MDLSNYTCDLTPDVVDRAREELHEVPADRVDACRAFYDWIKAQAHLSCPDLDTKFLLSFLRTAKWSQLAVRQKLEGWFNLKRLVPDWFQELDPLDPKIQKVLDTGFLLKLPKRDKNGCTIMMMRHAQLDVSFKSYSHLDVIRAMLVAGALLHESEATQVCGTVYLQDMTNITSKHLTFLMNRQDIERFSKCLRGNAPGRQKGLYYYNAGSVFETLMAFIKPFLPKKYHDRIRLYNSAESLYRDVPMDALPAEYLPDDYNGASSGRVEDILRQFKNELENKEFRDKLVYRSRKEFGLDSSVIPSGNEQASFRKLNVD